MNLTNFLDKNFQIIVIFLDHFKVHRRLSEDETSSFGETLNDSSGNEIIVRGTHYLVFGPSKQRKQASKASAEGNERFIQQQISLASWLFFSNISNLSYDEWKKSYENTVSYAQNDHLESLHSNFLQFL